MIKKKFILHKKVFNTVKASVICVDSLVQWHLASTHSPPFRPKYLWVHSSCRTITTQGEWGLFIGLCGSQSGCREWVTRRPLHLSTLTWCFTCRSPDLKISLPVQYNLHLRHIVSRELQQTRCSSLVSFPQTKTGSHGGGQFPIHYQDEQWLQGLHFRRWAWLLWCFYFLVLLDDREWLCYLGKILLY